MVSAGDNKGQWVQRRIMCQETHWVRYRTFFCSQQGRFPKHFDKLMDKGTILFMREYLAEHTEGITAQKLAQAIHSALLGDAGNCGGG
jgi:hypothetical protein